MKHTVIALLAGALASSGAFAQPSAQTFPQQSVTMIVGTAPGAGMDLTTRLIADKLSALWSQPVVVENRAGGSGTIAVNRFKSAKDAHTLLVADIGMAAINPSLYPTLSYEPRTDLVPVTDMFQTNFLFLVRPDKYDTLDAVVRAAVAEPGKLNYGSAGVGSGQRLSVELFKQRTGTPLTYIPYRGNSDAIVALIGGDVDLVSLGLPPVKGYLDEGKLKAVASTGPERSAVTPDVATLAELTQFKDLSASSWVGVFAPPGTAADVVEKIRTDIGKVLTLPDVQAYYASNDYQAGGSAPRDFGERIEADRALYKDLIEAANITVN